MFSIQEFQQFAKKGKQSFMIQHNFIKKIVRNNIVMS